MSVAAKSIQGLLVFVVGLGLGYLARKRGWLAEDRASRLAEANLAYLLPPGVLLLFWSLEPLGWRLAVLPLICALIILLLWPLSAFVGHRLFRDTPSLGPWVLCGMYSNQGLTYSAFLAYILLGTQGAALASLFVIPFSPLLYLLGFTVIGHYLHGGQRSPWAAFAQTFRVAYSRNPILSVALGLLLFASGIPVPRWADPVLQVLIPLHTFVALFAIGLSLRLSTVPAFWKPVAAMHGVKFLLQPALGLALAWAFGLWGQQDNLLVKVVYIETAAPVAIMALVLAQVSGLNLHLSNALWVTTNLFAIAWAPLTLWIAKSL